MPAPASPAVGHESVDSAQLVTQRSDGVPNAVLEARQVRQ